MMNSNNMKRKLKGWCRVEICGAFPETVLNACAIEALEFWNVECADDYTLRFSVYEAGLTELESITRKCMCEMTVKECTGGRESRRFLKSHIWFIICVLFALCLLFVSSLFIWDVDIYGCEELSEGEVQRALAACGVDYGCYWPRLNTDLLRSEVLTRLPQLAWMTVNVSGSRAVVLVTEREEKPEIYAESDGADMIAAETGIISKLTVRNGRAVVGTGQAVVKGETLISGTLDSLSGETRAVRAQGEVFAKTWRSITAVCPAESSYKTDFGLVKRRLAIKFGKTRINFYINGRNSVDECDKIIHTYKLGIDGLFILPVSFVVEEFRPYESESGSTKRAEEMGAHLNDFLRRNVSGEILSSSLTDAVSGGLFVVTLRAACLENIAELAEYTE